MSDGIDGTEHWVGRLDGLVSVVSVDLAIIRLSNWIIH